MIQFVSDLRQIPHYVIQFVSDLRQIPHYVIQFVSDLRRIPHYVIQFVSDLRQVGGFYSSTPVSSTNKFKTAEILLKVALNTITLLFTVISKTERESVHSPWRQRSLPIYRYTCIQTCCCKWLKFFQLSNIRLGQYFFPIQ